MGFQYHTGSIQTYSFLVAFAAVNVISIPHWFYSNCFRHHPMELKHCISIPHWFYSNCRKTINTRIQTKFQYHTGSIQTLTAGTVSVEAITFQYHTGSIQTSWRHIFRWFCSRFQYHTGSIQTRKKPVFLCYKKSFQYHTGSIQTESLIN